MQGPMVDVVTCLSFALKPFRRLKQGSLAFVAFILFTAFLYFRTLPSATSAPRISKALSSLKPCWAVRAATAFAGLVSEAIVIAMGSFGSLSV